MPRLSSRVISLVMALILVLTLGLPAPAQGTNAGGVDPITQWSRDLETAPVYTAEIERGRGESTGVSQSFTLKAKVGRLSVDNRGMQEIQLAVNGQALRLTPDLNPGGTSVDLDISNLIKYGKNTIEIRALGKPGASAIIRVEEPVLRTTLLYLNDLHGAINPLPKIAAKVNQLRASRPNVILFDAGDNFSGNPVVDLNQGIPMIEALNALKVDALTVGNHDFDYGQAAFAVRRSESRFPWLAANVKVTGSGVPFGNPDEVWEYETPEGQRIVVFGVTETPPSTSPKNTTGLTFNDPIATAREMVARYRDRANLLIALTHVGLDVDVRLAQEVQGLDAIIGGHSHTVINTPRVENGTPIAQAGSGGNYLGVLEVAGVSGSYSVSGSLIKSSTLVAEDPEVKAMVDGWNARLAELLGEVIGTTPRALNRDARFTQDVSIGNLITDAMRDAMGTDIALTNNGGIRASIGPGDITLGEVFQVMPFGNYFMTYRLTGAQLQEIIRFSYTRPDSTGKPRNQIDLQTAGLTYVIYTDAGNFVEARLKVNGQPIDPAATYTVAVSDYIGYGGSGYAFPAMASPIDFSRGTDVQVVADFIRRLGVVDYSDTEGRIQLKAAPAPVRKLNFYSTSSLLGSGLQPLSGQEPTSGQGSPSGQIPEVLAWSETTAYQTDYSGTAPKIDYPAGLRIPLAAWEPIGAGTLTGLGAIFVSDGGKYTTYDNYTWMANLVDATSPFGRGTPGKVDLFIDAGHDQYFATRMTGFVNYLRGQGYNVVVGAQGGYLKPAVPITREALQNVGVILITTPKVAYTADEIAVFKEFVEGGGSVILASQSDYLRNNRPGHFNSIADGLGGSLRFNDDQVNDSVNRDSTYSHSIVTDEFDPDHPELLRARYQD